MPGFEVIGEEEYKEIRDLFENSKILFRHGFDKIRNDIYKVRDFEKKFSEKFNIPDALAVSSGTAALKVALKALDIGKGDEVITQAFTFVATVESIVEVGAKPVIANIDKSLNISPADIELKITNKTKAIIVVHMLGIPSDMTAVMKIANKYKIKVIEDTAWGCGGTYNDQYLGTIGDLGTFSFDFAKTITTGEGGMVVAKDPKILESAKAYHDHGHENNPLLPRWEDSRSRSGFNYRMTEMQGAVGLAQLKKLDYIIASHQKNKQAIIEKIKDLPLTFREKPVKFEDTSDALIFYVKDKFTALRCRENLLSNGISTKILPEAYTWHFAGTWKHIPELYDNWDEFENSLQNSKQIISKAVSLPISVSLGKDHLNIIYKSIKDACTN
ncbi:DegT/DnrJ/EryC1/StrS family aminotransferase [Flavobacteriaceae bacterium]|nr:DegT/DnrJ/EryC1/StrS family aminotransferase [Flavobacteriaceae bacterium]|tara:strand:- start:1086 stop:2243 length:1158 start_codon:yes stop_codon:yes gene_type:complete